MDVEVGIDTTGDTPRSFYDGHGHPFLPLAVRDGTAVPDRSDGQSELFVQPGPITLFSRRGVPFL